VSEAPPVAVHPPVLVAGALGAALLLGWLAPVRLSGGWPGLGALLVGAALGLGLWAVLALREARTGIPTWEAATALVTTGPYAWSRNPIYLAMALLMAGLALASGSLWMALAAAGAVAGLDRGVIAREEPYLAARFGADYAAYRARVRRWL
jgi:protein-S-isoprenylcysteine O-methyltransferase Ste14